MLKSSGVEDTAGMFVDVLRREGKAFFDGRLMFNMVRQLRLRGTNDWSRYDFVLDVPDDGVEIYIGFSLKGSGVVWADDFVFEIVDSSVPVTAIDYNTGPTNLSFEEPN
jgi:hypothetical protein